MEIAISKKMISVKSVDDLPEKFKAAFQKFVNDYPSFQGRLGNIEYRDFGDTGEIRTVAEDGMKYWINIQNGLDEYFN